MTTRNAVVQKLLVNRGLNKEQIEEFFSWDLKSLPDMSKLLDIDVAVKLINKAILNGDKIGIYGDYDVDGTTSCAVFYHFFKKLGVEVSLIQPSRFIEGYGIHNCSIDKAIEDGINLLITVDCGISNVEVADYAKEKGLDLIITDHHKDAREKMPDALAIVNPKRRDEDPESELRNLSGAGVAFAICVELRKYLIETGVEVESIYDLLQFVAIGTICDLVPLSPMNLKLVRHGMQLIKNTKYPGVKAFFTDEELSLDIIPSEKLSFNVGPLINSKGRLDHPEAALRLLTTDCRSEAKKLHHELKICNEDRKIIQKEVYQEASNQALRQIANGANICIVYEPHWHAGVIGIVASRLVETYRVPAIVFCDAENEGIIKASVRSAGDLDIFSLLELNKDLFVKFGGHKAAAGLSMPFENLTPFKANMEKQLLKIPKEARVKKFEYDLEISPEDVDFDLLKSLESLEPFGMGNRKPKFKLKDGFIKDFALMKDIHVKWTISPNSNPNKKLKGVSFNFVDKWGQLNPDEIMRRQKENSEDLEVYFTLSWNHFNGNSYIQLMIDKIDC